MTDQEKELKKKKKSKNIAPFLKLKLKNCSFFIFNNRKKGFWKIIYVFFLSSRACQKNFESLW